MGMVYLYPGENSGLGEILSEETPFEAPRQLQKMVSHYLQGSRNDVQNFINWLRQQNVQAGWTKINGSLVGYVLLDRDEDNWERIIDRSVRMGVSIRPIWE